MQKTEGDDGTIPPHCNNLGPYSEKNLQNYLGMSIYRRRPGGVASVLENKEARFGQKFNLSPRLVI